MIMTMVGETKKMFLTKMMMLMSMTTIKIIMPSLILIKMLL